MFMADTKDKQPFGSHPDRPLRWQYRRQGDASWTDLTAQALVGKPPLVEVEAPWQIVRLFRTD